MARGDVSPSPEPRLALSILVVDDEDLIRWSLKRGLIGRGHQVTEAGSAAGALRALAAAARPFDVILLDYHLPDRHDLTLLRDLRQATPASEIFMMTAFGEGGMRHDAAALGVRAVFDKPFRVSDIVGRVEACVDPAR
jgi:CheY-like chemotaxis protein